MASQTIFNPDGTQSLTVARSVLTETGELVEHTVVIPPEQESTITLTRYQAVVMTENLEACRYYVTAPTGYLRTVALAAIRQHVPDLRDNNPHLTSHTNGRVWHGSSWDRLGSFSVRVSPLHGSLGG